MSKQLNDCNRDSRSGESDGFFYSVYVTVRRNRFVNCLCFELFSHLPFFLSSLSRIFFISYKVSNRRHIRLGTFIYLCTSAKPNRRHISHKAMKSGKRIMIMIETKIVKFIKNRFQTIKLYSFSYFTQFIINHLLMLKYWYLETLRWISRTMFF